MSLVSVNNKVICKPYKKEAKLKPKQTGGFAYIEQKTKFVALEVLLSFETKDVKLSAGDFVFVREETAHTTSDFTKIFSCDTVKEDFISVDFGYVEFVLAEGLK